MNFFAYFSKFLYFKVLIKEKMSLFKQGKCSVLVTLTDKMVRIFKNTICKAPKKDQESRISDFDKTEKQTQLRLCSLNFLGNHVRSESSSKKENLPGFYQLVYSLKKYHFLAFFKFIFEYFWLLVFIMRGPFLFSKNELIGLFRA